MKNILVGRKDGAPLDHNLTLGKVYNLKQDTFKKYFLGDGLSYFSAEPFVWEEAQMELTPEPTHEELTFGELPEKASRKNSGKSQFSYILDLPNACAGVSAAFAMGAEKYERDNWKKGFDRKELIDSAMRHLVKAENGEVFDEESGLDHLHHFAWNAMILAEQFGTTKPEAQDGFSTIR